MPLDGTELFENPVLAKLGQVERLLATEDQWCKGRLHDRRGRHCLAGAIMEADARAELNRPIIQAIKETTGRHYWRVESFNDDPSTNHHDVLRVLRRARLIIISSGAPVDQPKQWYLKLVERIGALFPTPAESQLYNAELRTVPAPIRASDADCREYVRSRESIHEISERVQ